MWLCARLVQGSIARPGIFNAIKLNVIRGIKDPIQFARNPDMLFHSAVEKLNLQRVGGIDRKASVLQIGIGKPVEAVTGNRNFEIRLVKLHPFVSVLGKRLKARKEAKKSKKQTFHSGYNHQHQLLCNIRKADLGLNTLLALKVRGSNVLSLAGKPVGLKKYIQLATQILKNGTLRSGRQNFNAERAKNLETLQEFIPEGRTVQQRNSFPYLLAQAAFIRASFRKKGGHIRVGDLAYIRIPKSANTSVSYAMLIKKYPALQEKNPNETQINFLADVNLLSVKEVANERFFTVVRNPFARIVSVYRDFFETNRGQFMYEDYLFGILKHDLSFAAFVDRISKIPDKLKDQHLKPQHLFTEPYERLGIAVQFFQLEDSPALKSFLNENEMELTHHNKSGAAYDYTQYYTRDLLQQVYALYQTDIEKFGYGQVYELLKDRIKV